MDAELSFSEWQKFVTDPELVEELNKMHDKEDAFYRDLEFGTGGLRGVIGAGTNRMNIYTVNKATQGLCDYLKEMLINAQDSACGCGCSAAIAFDSRIKSDEFAKSAACVFAANGVTAFIFDTLMPTPVLSYAVRELHCSIGIVITASHNPSEYNGYKVYGSDGCQLTPDAANCVQHFIEKIDTFHDVRKIDYDKGKEIGLIKSINPNVPQHFLDDVEKCSVYPELIRETSLNMVYTPLNGTGSRPVALILRRMGIKNLQIVPEQESPDGNFPTCKKPNPEERAAFEKAIELGKRTNADILLATDPDCDRVGVAVMDKNGEYILLTGNETGCLLLDYVLSGRRERGSLPENPIVVKTIVTTALAYKIAEAYGARVIDTLTGFKFIGEQIGLLEKSGEEKRFVFGFEESYGYLPGSYVRDKDAVAGSMLIAEMASFYKKRGYNLLEALQELYSRFGCYRHRLASFVFEGSTGMDKMKKITETFRGKNIRPFAGHKVLASSDYLSSVSTDMATGQKKHIWLPKSDVVLLALENDCEIVVRPSGTEPKLKCYLTAKGADVTEADHIIDALEKDISAFINEAGA